MKLGCAILGLGFAFAGAAMAAEALLLPPAPDPRIDLPWTVGAPAGPAFTDCADVCPEMVPLPDGEITVGSPPEEAGRTPDEAQSRVRVVNLALGRFEVTRGQYAAFAEAAGRSAVGGCPTDRRRAGTWRDDSAATWRDPGFDQIDREPVVCVSHADAEAYVVWLSARTGKPYRLPTEAEFEYAARAGSAHPYPWGSGVSDACAFANGRDAAFKRTYAADTNLVECDDGALHTAPVGSYWANAFGLHDMIGNVWEWTATCFVDCARRLQRGGGWGAGPVDLRSTQRVGVLADTRDSSTGFRVARDLP